MEDLASGKQSDVGVGLSHSQASCLHVISLTLGEPDSIRSRLGLDSSVSNRRGLLPSVFKESAGDRWRVGG